MNISRLFMLGLFASIFFGARAQKDAFASYDEYPLPQGDLTEMTYTPLSTNFKVWAPTARKVTLSLYDRGEGGTPIRKISMTRMKDGTWQAAVTGDCQGQYYTFNVCQGKEWLGETPGINARAVGVNGKRAAIISMRQTNPEGWEADCAPEQDDIVIYEMHHRDFSMSSTSGIAHKGKFLALTEEGTRSPEGLSTGLDHLKDLGVTHVHILPSYDYASVDEKRLDVPQYNWGYDPQNYNVPEGSYSTDPADPKARIREFKQMVQALHKAGIRVVLDVVFNHVFDVKTSNFELTVPGYFYRTRPDGTLANASGCGNETASERAVMRQYICESVAYWMKEYHIDGFRFDLMGVHDIETMRQVRAVAEQILPSVLIYGEGWAAESPQLPQQQLAMKANTHRLPGVGAFSDELRDALRGPFSDDTKGAFLAGLPGQEESIKFGIAGAISHPQVDMSQVNYSTQPWAGNPHQMISYVSCHDDMCLVDRLKSSVPGLTEPDLVRLDLLAQTAVFTSQGIPFMLAGEELLRDKKGVHNSFNSPDSVNVIDWSRKAAHPEVYDYYKGLISLRKQHPAFRLGDADAVRRHLEFLPVEGANVVAYRLKDHAGGDEWQDVVIVLNARSESASVQVPQGDYLVVCRDGRINLNGLGRVEGAVVEVPARSALIMGR